MHEKSINLLKTSNHPLDQWPWEGNFPEPLSAREMRRFQQQIDRICGLAVNGRPNVRLIWPASSDTSISMHYVDGELRARYVLYSQEYDGQSVTPGGLIKVERITVDIVAPRWILEEYDEKTDSYLHFKSLAVHDERCCEGTASVNGQLCHGLYREPERCDLEELQRVTKLREQFPGIVRPDEMPSYHEIQAHLQRIRQWHQVSALATKQKYKEAILNGLMPQSPRLFSTDPTVQKWGKYHFLGDKHSKSGS